MLAPDKPFFLYYAPGACHAPHHAPKQWIDKFRGRFDMGYEAMREQTLARQKEMGIVPADTEMPPVNPLGTMESHTDPAKQMNEFDTTRPWDTLSDEEKRLFSRMAEVYAGFLAHADHHIGLLLDYLEETGQLDNTMILLVSDNGASGEGGPNGSVNENKMANGIKDDITENLAKLDDLGGTRTYNHYPTGWAMAFNTPFKMWKRYEFNGGTADPCIIAWPKGIKARGQIRHQYHHAIDLVPTILDVLDVEMPTEIKGYTQSPMDGVSMRYSFDDASAKTTRRTQFYSMLGSRSIWHDGWKAVTTHIGTMGWGDYANDTWELYNTENDRSECRDLAAAGARAGSATWSTCGTCRRGRTTHCRLTTGARWKSSPPRARSCRRRVTSTPITPAWPRCPRGRRSTSATAPTRSECWWTSPARGRRGCCSRTARGSAGTRSTSRTAGCTTSTTSSAAPSSTSPPTGTSRPGTT